MQVFQLRAEGPDSLTGGSRRRINSSIVFTTMALAEGRREKFRTMVNDAIENPVITIVPLDVISDSPVTLPATHSPDSYDPPLVEKRSEVVYGAGYEEQPGSYGMYDGPTPDIYALLNSIPCGVNPCIIRFNLDGSDEVIYRWHTTRKLWILQE